MWSPYSIENKSMALSYDVYMDENGNLIPQNMSQELYIHSSSVTYEEYRNNNLTLIENNIMIGNTMVNSSAMIVNNLNIGGKRYFIYGSSGLSLINGTSTNISGVPVRWQSSGFVRGVKAYSNGTDALILPYAVHLRSGGIFAMGTLIIFLMTPQDFNMTGNALTIEVHNEVCCKNGGASASYTFPIYPSYTVYGTLKGSNGHALGGAHLYFKDNSNNMVYEITMVDSGSNTGYFIFYANAHTSYTIEYGSDYTPLTTFTSGSFGGSYNLITLTA